MEKYQNEGLNIIAERYPDIDFSDVDGKNIARVGAICTVLGIDVVFAKLSNGLSGYFDHTKKIIFVNDEYPATRNLFTIAHELGHYILHDGTNNRYNEYHKYTPEERKREYEANDFAAKLLMPVNKFVAIFNKKSGDLKTIAHIFGVSEHMCEVRAFNLGLINLL